MFGMYEKTTADCVFHDGRFSCCSPFLCSVIERSFVHYPSVCCVPLCCWLRAFTQISTCCCRWLLIFVIALIELFCSVRVHTGHIHTQTQASWHLKKKENGVAILGVLTIKMTCHISWLMVAISLAHSWQHAVTEYIHTLHIITYIYSSHA